MQVTGHRRVRRATAAPEAAARGHRPAGARTVVGAAVASVAALAAGAGPAVAVTPASTAPAAASVGTRAAAAASAVRVASIPISFTVRNVNRSKVACGSDGKTYTVRGHLVAPAGAVRGGATRTATLYLHGLGFGQFLWTFEAVKGYDYAATMARAGQTSVVVDRLGYGASSKPDGNAICVGSRADIAHQMVQDLRSGHYTLRGHRPVGFGRVVLAGHSYGSQIAEVEAYSFGDVNGLIQFAYADRVQSLVAQIALTIANENCATGGKRVNPGGPRHYTPFGDPVAAPMALFNNAAPAVTRAALPQVSIDPCGDDASFAKAVTVDLRNAGKITAPVLIVEAGADAFFPPPAAADQAALFTHARSVSTAVVPGSGHAITLSIHRAVLDSAVLTFLRTKITNRR